MGRGSLEPRHGWVSRRVAVAIRANPIHEGTSGLFDAEVRERHGRAGFSRGR